MSKFKVGDVCVIVQTSAHHENLGRECTIIGIPSAADRLKCDGHVDWQIDIHGVPQLPQFMGTPWCAESSQLRLKRPPADYDGNQAGSWDLIPWQPSKVRERV